MIFYEDFVKKIEELEGEDLSFSEIESFGLGKKENRRIWNCPSSYFDCLL